MTHIPATNDLKEADLMTLVKTFVKLTDALYELSVKPKPRMRVCRNCERTSHVWHGNQKYCQHSCRQKAYLWRTGRLAETPWKRCRVCGWTFWANRGTQLTCSERCRKYRQNFLVRTQRRRIEPRHNQDCTVCGEGFVSRVGHAKYCGDACRKVATNAQQRLRYAEQKANTAPKRRTKTCVICEMEFSPQRNTAKYCNAQCKRDADNARRRSKRQTNNKVE